MDEVRRTLARCLVQFLENSPDAPEILVVVQQDQSVFHGGLGNETVVGRADGYAPATAIEVDTGCGDRRLDRILGQVDWLRLEIASVLGELPVARCALENLLQDGRGEAEVRSCA